VAASAFIASVLALMGCSAPATAETKVGDCLDVGGPPGRQETSKVRCGSLESDFKVVAVVETTSQCPADVDPYYSRRSSFSGSGSIGCMDIDWVVGGCMSVDPAHHRDPTRVDCGDPSASNRQRATQIMQNVANADQCATGLGYAYTDRKFTVCVERVS
jgi:hypothetical protein